MACWGGYGGWQWSQTTLVWYGIYGVWGSGAAAGMWAQGAGAAAGLGQNAAKVYGPVKNDQIR
ncbi:hypothetical protein VNI00_019133, partial [Paramarasmius palmivorus]